MSLADIYKEFRQVARFPKPKALQVMANTNRSLFCEYHHGFGHKMEDFYDLYDVMEQLVREGRLVKYIASQRSPRKRRVSPIRDEERRNLTTQRTLDLERVWEYQEDIETITKTINVIVGGFAGGGITKLAHKKYLQEVLSLSTANMKKAHKTPSTLEIVFSSSDLEKVIPGHDDPMIISAVMVNAEVKRVYAN